MTREEAIKILKTDGCYECPVGYSCSSPYHCNNASCDLREATYMAIRSLEAWDNLEKEMEEEIYSYDAFPDIWYGISEVYDIIKKYSKEV